jgi:D-glycero-alpha-D-manno-heptose-7-phosphate kinase
MIITKTPFRVSFCGGGSDMADFYRKHGGCVLSTSINKYMYISVHPYFNENQTALKYSQNEIVDDVSQIQHRIIKQVLTDMQVSGVEIVSTADVPSGTGLGSSSAFTVGLLHTLNCYKGKYVSQTKLAEDACKVEIEKLGAPIGKQDQYASACGGLNMITFHKNDKVTVEPIIMDRETYHVLENNLVMFYTGITHDANKILAEQKLGITQADKTDNLLHMCNLAREMKESLEKNDISEFGRILNEGWHLKKQLASSISGQAIDAMYEKAMKSGAAGGKLLGAGGGGFLLFYCEKEKQAVLEAALELKRFDFRFEYDGTSVVYIGDRYW